MRYETSKEPYIPWVKWGAPFRFPPTGRKHA